MARDVLSAISIGFGFVITDSDVSHDVSHSLSTRPVFKILSSRNNFDMRRERESTLAEYARQYWQREVAKEDPRNSEALRAIDAGENPVAWLREVHPYKLPKPKNELVSVVLITAPDEVRNLLVHDYMPKDDWMKERDLVPEPWTRHLGALAAMCLDRKYFSSRRKDRQIRNYGKWRADGNFSKALGPGELPLIESIGPRQYEIVDGWGRLLPFAALLIERFPFVEFEVFLAHESTHKI
ncbi:MAG TPA: hypothetical protein VKM56_04250 [Verrucomicrobiae bacterium]|nr:hypothetical protein [Verrucomicrobiae bacterium]